MSAHRKSGAGEERRYFIKDLALLVQSTQSMQGLFQVCLAFVVACGPANGRGRKLC